MAMLVALHSVGKFSVERQSSMFQETMEKHWKRQEPRMTEECECFCCLRRGAGRGGGGMDRRRNGNGKGERYASEMADVCVALSLSHTQSIVPSHAHAFSLILTQTLTSHGYTLM